MGKGKLLKAASKAIKKNLTKKNAIKLAGSAVKDNFRKASRAASPNKPWTLQSDRPKTKYNISATIPIKGDRKKRKQLKKIEQWKKSK